MKPASLVAARLIISALRHLSIPIAVKTNRLRNERMPSIMLNVNGRIEVQLPFDVVATQRGESMTCKIFPLMTALLVVHATNVLAAGPSEVVDLWPGSTPGESAAKSEETITGEPVSRRVAYVSRPTLTVLRPSKAENTGAAVIIAPGGGYRFLSWDHEGLDVATWLNTIGVT